MCTTVNINESNYDDLPILYLGSQGEAVRILQNFLSQLGHYFGEVNGYFCINTERSVRVFQFQAGLPSNGIVTERTWKAINRLKRFLGF